jgi:hypothetical protein
MKKEQIHDLITSVSDRIKISALILELKQTEKVF